MSTENENQAKGFWYSQAKMPSGDPSVDFYKDHYDRTLGSDSSNSNTSSNWNLAPTTPWSKIAGLLMLLGVMFIPAAIRYHNLSGAEADAWLSTILNLTGYIIAVAPPVIVGVFFENGGRALFLLILCMIAIVVFTTAAIFVIQHFTDINLMRVPVRDWTEPLRAYISPARLLTQILPAPMAPAAWFIAFSFIVTFASIWILPKESMRVLVLTSALIVVGCFLLL